MPPRIRSTKGSKPIKENFVAVSKTKSKSTGKITKPARKALADKTNSASDDNTSLETRKINNNHEVITELENMPRPRRERRIPTRFIGNNVLKNLSNSKDQSDSENVVTRHTPVIAESSFKTPQKSLDNSLVVNRPKRMCRLPSKFEDHSISPSKYIPVQPCHASTPILENKSSKLMDKAAKSKEKQIELKLHKIIPAKRNPQKRHIQNSPETSSDSNNNAKKRLVQHKITPSPKEKVKTIKNLPKKNTNKNFSFRVLEDKKKSSSNEDNNLDVYEFTYDPNEEPVPAKKKRKKTVKKKPAKPKTIMFKNNYDKNVSKALAALKNAFTKKPDVPKVTLAVENVNTNVAYIEHGLAKQNVEQKLQQNSTQASIKDSERNKSGKASIPENATNPSQELISNSVRVEDIAADFEMSVEDYNDINYSPVNSPQRPKSPVVSHQQTLERSVHNNDPLNLREDISFFDENPVASSSMNTSTRHPQASPWRIEFGNLPIKWQVNTYVKPNMTPAVESSFISSEDNKKKHVYTNLIANDDNAPEIVQNHTNLKQTRIISFIREVVERSAQKKKKGAATPTKPDNLFDKLSKGNNDKTPKKSEKPVQKNSKINEDEVNSSENSIQDKENSNKMTEHRKKKSKMAEKDKNGTFFGFDESEDLENVSPVKVNPKLRTLRPRSKAVLQEINAMTGPMRALPLAAKTNISTSSDAVNKVFEEMKSAADAPVFPDKRFMRKTSEVTTVDEVLNDVDEDSQSVHLFEDIELVHHLKPTRKSYGKAKKVTFRQHSISSKSPRLEREEPVSSEEDDLADLTFTMPSFEPQKKAKKKKTKKRKMSKKEQQALDEWAAGFNSMCEDIEEVPLNVE